MGNLFQLWVYLAQTPLLWLTTTVLVYWLAAGLAARLPRLALLNPVLLSIVALVLLLTTTRTPYAAYFEGAQFVHFLLGPATVALAIPLYLYQERLRQRLLPVLVALVAGSAAGVISAALFSRLLGLDEQLTLSLLPKSVTTPIAMGIAERIGGLPSLTAVLVILTGMTGALLGGAAMDMAGVRDSGVRGFALGLASHGLGTARALQIDAEAGAFAGLAMGLNGAVTAILVPLILALLPI